MCLYFRRHYQSPCCSWRRKDCSSRLLFLHCVQACTASLCIAVFQCFTLQCSAAMLHTAVQQCSSPAVLKCCSAPSASAAAPLTAPLHNPLLLLHLSHQRGGCISSCTLLHHHDACFPMPRPSSPKSKIAGTLFPARPTNEAFRSPPSLLMIYICRTIIILHRQKST